jgi:hypothetical protein
MLSFAVFDDDQQAQQMVLRHAHLVGKDDLVVAGKIEFADGIISCRKPMPDEVCLALQFDTGRPGRLTVRTCLLPDREQPYLLELELARRRIMLFLNKLEEWSLSDLPAEHPAMVAFEEARELFTTALCFPVPKGEHYCSAQARAARESLMRCIEAGELLAIHNAEQQLAARLGSKDAMRPIPLPRLGVAVHNEQFSEPLKKVIASTFDFLVSPMRWCEIEAEEGRFTFTATDRWIEWAVRHGRVPVVGGPILSFGPGGYPDWLGVWEHDYDSLREFAYEHAKRVVTRYRRTVSRWIAISGVNLNNGFSFSIDQMIEMTRLAVLLVRKLQPSAKIVVEVTQPFGEHASANAESISPLLYAELVLEAGISFDALGVCLQMGDGTPGRSSRDLMQLSAVLDLFSHFEKPVDVTALGAPSIPASDDDASTSPGHWREPWTPELQASWMTEAMKIAMSKSFVRSVCWQALYDTESVPEMPHGGLISREGRAKPALRRMAEIRMAIRKRRVPAFDAEPATSDRS